jgi:hypothetical protein
MVETRILPIAPLRTAQVVRLLEVQDPELRIYPKIAMNKSRNKFDAVPPIFILVNASCDDCQNPGVFISVRSSAIVRLPCWGVKCYFSALL